MARSPDHGGLRASLAWAAAVAVGLVLALIATAAMANAAYNGESGQVTSRTNPKISTVWSYLPNSSDRRLSGVVSTWLTTGQNTGFAYATNAVDQITGATQTADAGASIPLPATSRTQVAVYNTNSNSLNQLQTLTTNGTPATLAWNTVGDLKTDATRTYAWDAANRLASVAVAGQTVSFTYDGLGRRTSITRPPPGGGTAVTTNYIWCGDTLCQAQNATGGILRAYYAECELVSGSSAKAWYYGPDNLGSVRRAFGKTASPTYDYDAYGVALPYGVLATTPPVTDFGHAGMVYEPTSGLYLTAYRSYDPVTGRFQSRDPAGENADPEGNLYPYAANDPVNHIDPLGLDGEGGSPLTLDLFGGSASQTPGAANVDVIAEQGVRASATQLPFANGAADKIVANNPYILGGKGIMDYLPVAARVLTPDGKIIINSTARNPFGKLPAKEELNNLKLEVDIKRGSLPEEFNKNVFQTTNGGAIENSLVKTTILKKTCP